MNNDFDLSNMPSDVYLNAEGEESSVGTKQVDSCGKKPMFMGKRRDAYNQCLASKENKRTAELAAAKAIAESAAAEVQVLQADAAMKNADSIKSLQQAQAVKEEAAANAVNKARLAEKLKGATAISTLANQKLDADRAAIAVGKETNWFMWGVVIVAVVVGAKMLMKSKNA